MMMILRQFFVLTTKKKKKKQIKIKLIKINTNGNKKKILESKPN